MGKVLLNIELEHLTTFISKSNESAHLIAKVIARYDDIVYMRIYMSVSLFGLPNGKVLKLQLLD